MIRAKMFFLFAKNGKNEGYCPRQKRLSLDAAKQRIRKGGTLSVEAKVRFVQP